MPASLTGPHLSAYVSLWTGVFGLLHYLEGRIEIVAWQQVSIS